MKDQIGEFVRILKDSQYVTVLTGAGVSVPSGIPDFRSPNGLYSRYGENIFDIEYFNSNPDRFYQFAKEGLFEMLDAQPNAAHKFLVKLEEIGKVKGVITQNIDGLHTKAGSTNVAEIHGTVRTWHCLKCLKRYNVLDETERNLLTERNFRCTCGGLTKPDIVFFGEMLPMNEFSKAENWAKNSDLFIAMGTSLVVYPAAQLPLYAIGNGAKFVIVTKGETPFDKYADMKFGADVAQFAELLSEKLGFSLA
ncbi:MAG TPA: NAD-dependent protein deacylase [Fervidobacterium sp.]|jgi:NAD-dependent deacetylase|nr:NAD-dependent protein deacylase [Fervidobacterium sp.]HPT59100.1 NAD-dependent protein deacylase [Fervidobacterium sp.]HQI93997.1 NAD-dependent protein deacylase [Fervidobacterium sp.]